MIKEHIHNISNIYNKKIALFADLHFSYRYPKKKFNEIIENLNKNKPDYICIPGDIIDEVKVLKNKKLVDQLKKFLISLSKISPVILSYGNHDEMDIKFFGASHYDTSNFFNGLNNLPNIYFLDNNSIILDNINFIGYHSAFSFFEKKEKINLENIDIINNKISLNHCNILLCHSPNKILDSNVSVDYILSGHMHNGLVLGCMEKIKSNRGLVGPHRTFFPKLSRGVITKEKTKLIITGGIIKISNSASVILRLLNLFYSSDIDYINL